MLVRRGQPVLGGFTHFAHEPSSTNGNTSLSSERLPCSLAPSAHDW